MNRKDVLALWKKASACIADEITNNEEFAKKIGSIFEASSVAAVSSNNETSNSSARKGKRRKPAKVNPFFLLEQGVESLKEGLEDLDTEELKDIISENGMDSARLAMKWKDPNRLINHIIEATQRRSSRGEAFWNTGSEKSNHSK
ncbi:hypothetical protein PTI45_02054 [Paenibacillus nuruki]|uniref:Uncharacterized protein n=1 Tax=Paenibacillus nuruki TaxID=1886670 RepID=A0A1E3L3X2_9BACL|nr:hypothetical protein [Paenibacillus nuruki]ODP28509.1 hypothetical protein PTI45_02054 [Paenibacillus nuruki]